MRGKSCKRARAVCPSWLSVNRAAWCNNPGKCSRRSLHPALVFCPCRPAGGLFRAGRVTRPPGDGPARASWATGEAVLQSAPSPSGPIKPGAHVATCRRGRAPCTPPVLLKAQRSSPLPLLITSVFFINSWAS